MTLTICMDDGKIGYVNNLKEARRFIKKEMPGVSSVSFLESANGYIAIEGSKKYPKGDTLAIITQPYTAYCLGLLMDRRPEQKT